MKCKWFSDTKPLGILVNTICKATSSHFNVAFFSLFPSFETIGGDEHDKSSFWWMLNVSLDDAWTCVCMFKMLPTVLAIHFGELEATASNLSAADIFKTKEKWNENFRGLLLLLLLLLFFFSFSWNCYFNSKWSIKKPMKITTLNCWKTQKTKNFFKWKYGNPSNHLFFSPGF